MFDRWGNCNLARICDLQTQQFISKIRIRISKAMPIYSAQSQINLPHCTHLITLSQILNLKGSCSERCSERMFPTFKVLLIWPLSYFSLYSFICYNERCKLTSELLSIWNILHCFHMFKTFLYFVSDQKKICSPNQRGFLPSLKPYRTIFTHHLGNSPHTELYDD